MDFRLKDYIHHSLISVGYVSILVLMDFRLKANGSEGAVERVTSFNPCSNGLSAQRARCGYYDGKRERFQSLF